MRRGALKVDRVFSVRESDELELSAKELAELIHRLIEIGFAFHLDDNIHNSFH